MAHHNYPGIIKGISIPIYTQLIHLELRFNTIHNIEALTFLNMERIIDLDVRDNRIVQAKALSKTRWPRIRTIHIGDNQFSEVNLHRMKIGNHLHIITLRNTSKM